MNHAEFLDHLKTWSEVDRGIVPEGTPDTAMWAFNRAQRACPPDQRPQWQVGIDNELRCGCRCPITYLANKENGSEYDVGEWEEAAAELGLEDDYALVDAADMIPGHDPHLRRKLLVACGILEPKGEG